MTKEIINFKDYKSGDKINIKIDKNCNWYYKNEKFTHPKILQYFKSLLGKDQKGYYLSNKYEKYYITVDDTPFCVNYIITENETMFVYTDSEKKIPLDFDKLIMRNNGIFYYTFDNIPMKFSRKAQADLLQYAIEENNIYYLIINNKKYKIKIDN